MAWPDSVGEEDHLLPVYDQTAESISPTGGTAQPLSARASRRAPEVAALGRIKSSRQNSHSSVDTADLMDHRDVVPEMKPTPGSFISRRRRSSTGPPGSFMGKPSTPSRFNTFSSPNFVDRLLKRGRSSSKAPLHPHDMREYEAILDDDGDASIGPSRDALAYDIESWGAEAHRGSYGRSDLDDMNPALSRVIDDSDGSEILGSEPLSRRSSSASSLGDVCLPVDSIDHVSTTSQGCSFNLSYLEEFATNERKELLALQGSVPADSIYNAGSGFGATTSIVSHKKVNEVDLERGRLRPYRVVPWNNNAPRTQSPFLANSTEFKSRFNKEEHRKKKSNAPPDMTPIEEGPNLRFTYFREDLDSTVHSSSISGLLQTGQTFDDLFNIGIYSARTRSYSGTHSAANSGRHVNLTESDDATVEGDVQPSPTLDPQALSEHARKAARLPTSGHATPTNGDNFIPTPLSRASSTPNGREVPANRGPAQPFQEPEPPHLDPSPFWLDILNPTEEEMKVLSKTFGIHPLTTEDIFLGETREKVELFRNYYLVCFRSFDIQDERTKRKNQSASAEESGIGGGGHLRRRMSGTGNSTKSESTKRRKNKQTSELTPLNMYIVVFHEGILTVGYFLHCFYERVLTR